MRIAAEVRCGQGKGAKGGCCSATGQCAVTFCGILFQLFGCGLLSYTVYYFIDKTANNLAYCLLSLAIANILVSFLTHPHNSSYSTASLPHSSTVWLQCGIVAFCFAPNGKSKCLMILVSSCSCLSPPHGGVVSQYILLMIVLTIAEMVGGVSLKVDEEGVKVAPSLANLSQLRALSGCRIG